MTSLSLGNLSNHDERDDDDLKYARRDWDEDVVFVGKLKLKQREAQGRRCSDSLRI